MTWLHVLYELNGFHRGCLFWRCTLLTVLHHLVIYKTSLCPWVSSIQCPTWCVALAACYLEWAVKGLLYIYENILNWLCIKSIGNPRTFFPWIVVQASHPYPFSGMGIPTRTLILTQTLTITPEPTKIHLCSMKQTTRWQHSTLSFVNPLTGNHAANWQLSGERGCSRRALSVCKYVNWQRGFTRGCQSKG